MREVSAACYVENSYAQQTPTLLLKNVEHLLGGGIGVCASVRRVQRPGCEDRHNPGKSG
jgi:hypothetical protein